MLTLDSLNDIAFWTILKLFNWYKSIARVLLKPFVPLLKKFINKQFAKLKINTNGEGPLGIQVHNEDEFYLRFALEKNVGLFESHMDKVCTINDIKALMVVVMKTRKTKRMVHPLTWVLGKFNLQSVKKSWQVGEDHYDVGNILYESMLDKNMQYTCGYWKNARNLDEAQLAKMELIAQKLKLEPGMRILDIGCGFGTLGYYLAKNYGVEVVGCSISKEQTKYGEALFEGQNLPVELRLCDYREINEKFDRVVSVGMFEHVGPKNYRKFFQVCNRCLTKDGILLLHTIGNNHPSVYGFDMWNHKYIFPNGEIPYYLDVCKAIEGLWVIEDFHNIGWNYTKTLKAWEENFDKAWPGKLSLQYDERFYRMWKIYLNAAQAFFLTRSFQVWQIVMSKDGLEGGYEAVRL